MDYLDADRCYYCEFENDKAIIRRDARRGNLPSVVGVYLLKDFPLFSQMMNDNAPLVINDVRQTELLNEELKQLCIQLQMISFINVPVVKNKDIVGNLCVTCVTPHDWTNFESAMVKEIAERTWSEVERTRSDEALHKSERRLQMILKSITDHAVITTDQKGIIDSWNKGAENAFGWTAEEIIGQPGTVIFTPEDRAAGIPAREMQTALKYGFADNRRLHIRKDGSRFFASGTISTLRDGVFEGFVKICLDQTERHQAEKAVREKETLKKNNCRAGRRTQTHRARSARRTRTTADGVAAETRKRKNRVPR